MILPFFIFASTYNSAFPQSFGTDELFIESKSLGRLFSHQSSKMEAEQGGKIGRQTSYQHQASAEGKEVKRVLSLAKKEEEWDKDIPSVPLHRVLALNAKEWWIIILGVIGAAVNGCIFPVFAIIFGEIIFVFSLDRNEILSEIGPWAGLFVVLGAVSGCGIFLKVVHLNLFVHVLLWFADQMLAGAFYPLFRPFVSPYLVRISPLVSAPGFSRLSFVRRLDGMMTSVTLQVLSPLDWHMMQDKSRG